MIERIQTSHIPSREIEAEHDADSEQAFDKLYGIKPKTSAVEDMKPKVIIPTMPQPSVEAPETLHAREEAETERLRALGYPQAPVKPGEVSAEHLVADNSTQTQEQDAVILPFNKQD